MIILKSPREINIMRKANQIVAKTHEYLQELIEPGITTAEINEKGDAFIREHGAEPSFKGYRGFPASICVSINDEVVHGIPSSQRVLQEGDIVSLDIGTFYKGFNGDAARTFPVGEISEEAQKLLKVTQRALDEGIKKAQHKNHLSDISNAIQSYVEKNNLSVVREYVGHGIGTDMHEAPQIPNFGSPGHGPVLKEGMTLAIEPMVNIGDFKVKTLDDNWTVVTEDGSLSAHFEHTIAITKKGPKVLSKV
jgi:methionyl aminopeptidase